MVLDKLKKYDFKCVDISLVEKVFNINDITLNPIYSQEDTIFGIENIHNHWYWINFIESEDEIKDIVRVSNDEVTKSLRKNKKAVKKPKTSKKQKESESIKLGEWYWVEVKGIEKMALIYIDDLNKEHTYGWNLKHEWTNNFNQKNALEEEVVSIADLDDVEMFFNEEIKLRGLQYFSKNNMEVVKHDGAYNYYKKDSFVINEDKEPLCNIHENKKNLVSLNGVLMFADGNWTKVV